MDFELLYWLIPILILEMFIVGKLKPGAFLIQNTFKESINIGPV